MATALNMRWKLPVAYFLIPDAFSSEKRAELLRNCIFHVNSTGAVVTSLVMDNCPVNYATFRRLGMQFSRNYEGLCTALDIQNTMGKSVMAMFDPPHLLKLVRNAIGSWKTLLDEQNNVIRWQHIVDLYEYQKKNGFTLANKITKQHVNFEKNKMKVKYAAHVISKSVANALLTMCEIKTENFSDVNATVVYLKTFDTIFDIMNSRTLAEGLSKAPLQKKNEDYWKSVFQSTAKYICTLKTNCGKLVLNSEKYASFLGWLVNIKTLSELFEYIVNTDELQFICTYKLSQDPLETFFSSIRMSLGCGNNPTTVQFKTAFKSLLCNSLNRKDNGNCIFDDSIAIPDMSSVSCDIDIDIPADYGVQNNKFVDNVLIYISGFMMKKLIDSEKCTYCYMYLTECKERVSCELINFKQLGGLKYPTFDVLAVVDISNRKMKLFFQNTLKINCDFVLH